MCIETNQMFLLVDPMLSEKGTMPSYTEKRFSPQKNPTAELPAITSKLLHKVTHCLITHLHTDHLDKKGEEFLVENNISVICSVNDAIELKERKLNIFKTIDYWKKTRFMDISIEGIPAKHGYGKVSELMGHVMGYFIKFSQTSIYLSSDTIYTENVEKVLKTYKPDISVFAAGSAQLDDYDPILMRLEDIFKFIENAPKFAIANHLDAVNHCRITRLKLLSEIKPKGLLGKTWIPDDGDSKIFKT
jgi:L-ascorbate metabolism protein UlaG (beta-lactamase superfamily)